MDCAIEMMMCNHGLLTWTGIAAAGFLPYVSQDAVLLPWRKDASEKMRVPKLSALCSGREKSLPQVFCIHRQQFFPTLRVMFGHHVPGSLQVEKGLRVRAYPAIFPSARSHAVKNGPEPGKTHVVHPVLMAHVNRTPWPSPILMHVPWLPLDHAPSRQSAWQSLPDRRVRLSRPLRPRFCPFHETP